MRKQRTATAVGQRPGALRQWLNEGAEFAHWEMHDKIRGAGDTAALVHCCERDFVWLVQPHGYRLMLPLVDACYSYLKAKRRPKYSVRRFSPARRIR